MMMMKKREREVDSITMANYLMMLSRGSSSKFEPNNYLINSYSSSNNRVFECKTCNRQFASFQALGGHRASHKKPRLMEGSENNSEGLLHGSSSPPKPKTHECSICGLEFAIGQALGGHMRRHRATTASNNNNNSGHYVASSRTTTAATTTTTTMMMSSSSGGSSSVDNNSLSENENGKKGSSSVLFLDLNLTPFENDLEFLKIGQPATTTTLVDCFN